MDKVTIYRQNYTINVSNTLKTVNKAGYRLSCFVGGFWRFMKLK